MVNHIIDHFSKKRRCDHLRLFIQCQIFDIEELFQDLRPGRTGSDPASFDLRTKFLILDQLTCIFHRKDHGTGIVSLRR